MKLGALAALLLACGSAGAQEPLPCVQILAPAMTPGQVWSGPALDGVVSDEPAVARLIAQVVDLGLEREALAAALRGFAAEAPDTLILPAVSTAFARLQAMRDDTLRTLATVATTQRQRLDRMDQRLRQLNTLPDSSPAHAALLVEQETDRRILEGRRRMIQAMCERPARIEARFGLVARTLAPRTPVR